MAPARIIADSDDSDDDFDLGDSPAKPPTPKPTSEERSSDPASAATGSTDPKFFQAIYNEQQGTAPDDNSAHWVPNVGDRVSVSAGAQVSTKESDTNTSSLTSITDPTMGSNRAKKPKKTEIVDLTQVTSPGRSADDTPKDMWDVPSSPMGGSTAPIASLANNKTPVSASKRKRGNNVEFTSPLVITMPSQGSTQPFDTTPAGRGNNAQAAKKQRIDAPQSSVLTEDDVDMVVVPRTNDSLLVDAPISGQRQRVSLYIEPHSLNESQRLQYEYHSVDPSPDDQKTATSRHLTTQQAAARSSGATTIAYSTPSQTRVRGVLRESYSDETNSGPVSQIDQETCEDFRQQDVPMEPQSSPDIISAAPARGNRDKSNESLQVSVPNPTDDWNSDDIGFPREMYKPRPSRRRGSNASRRGDSEETNPTEIPMADLGPTAQLPIEEAAPASPPKPKKRGRPKKSDTAMVLSRPTDALATPQSAAASEVAESPTVTDAAAAATQQTKKKRGRPRKAAKAVTADVQEPEEQHAGAEAAAQGETVVPEGRPENNSLSDKVEKPSSVKKSHTKRRPREEAPERRSTSEGPSDTEEARALQPTTPNAGLKSGSDGPDPQSAVTGRKVAAANNVDGTPGQSKDEKKEVAGKADGKTGVTTPASSQAGKPLYRVGLSKKSRIAPLLKSLRK